MRYLKRNSSTFFLELSSLDFEGTIFSASNLWMPGKNGSVLWQLLSRVKSLDFGENSYSSGATQVLNIGKISALNCQSFVEKKKSTPVPFPHLPHGWATPLSHFLIHTANGAFIWDRRVVRPEAATYCCCISTTMLHKTWVHSKVPEMQNLGKCTIGQFLYVEEPSRLVVPCPVKDDRIVTCLWCLWCSLEFSAVVELLSSL